MFCQTCSSHVVSFLDGAKHRDSSPFIMKRSVDTLRDYQIEGAVAFRGYLWNYAKHSDSAFDEALDLTYRNKGLVRDICSHEGLFIMNGRRQTCQASSVMNAPSTEGLSHNHNDPSIRNHTLEPLLRGPIKTLGEEAANHQQNCGFITLALIRKALQNDYEAFKTRDLCTSIIITKEFFNSLHKDCDEMPALASKKVKEYIKKLQDVKSLQPSAKQLLNWLVSFEKTFGDNCRLPMPTTCCWSFRGDEDSEWNHESYFVLMDACMTYDLSSNVMGKEQHGASFYGPLFNHCTSAPIWVSKCGKYATLICPEERHWNLAWGNTDGKGDTSTKLKNTKSSS